jgi:Flp pilus assembly protein TadG
MFRRLAGASDGAQIVEFAVTLPLLVVIFVGIYDFGQAFNTKQKLANATREGARFASNQSSNDLSMVLPPSIMAVRDVVDGYLTANNVNDCALRTAPVTPGGSLTWVFTATCSPGHDLTLTINRGFTYQVVSGGNTVTTEATQVSLVYPYQWQFSRVIQLVAPGATYAGFTNIPTNTVMQNLN